MVSSSTTGTLPPLHERLRDMYSFSTEKKRVVWMDPRPAAAAAAVVPLEGVPRGAGGGMSF